MNEKNNSRIVIIYIIAAMLLISAGRGYRLYHRCKEYRRLFRDWI
jgi:hypothetical protein